MSSAPLTKGDKLAIQKREKKQKRDADRARREAGRERLEQAKALYSERGAQRRGRFERLKGAHTVWHGGAFGAKNVYTPDDTDVDAGTVDLETAKRLAAFDVLERPVERAPHEVSLSAIMRLAKKRGGRRHEGAVLTNGQTFDVINEDVFSVASLEDEASEVDGWEVLSALSG
ncbi:hypothetical protein FA95DRAFT_1556250 [Auriscalpium vulgare]|uniref:Uncharacterized protein n=1 Tax=Auriscalpium vulgare TaxID=40419 RepID=A0ACB8S0N5_9AGAM|nr:hypothetical protein FA95DRAFT_1556250 [Auriscalpium vulgare]